MKKTQSQAADASAPRAILEAATRLFASKGFEAASVREIAEEARLAKPAIYYYFKSKEGLLEAVLDAAFEPLVERLEAINARGEPADAVRSMVDAVTTVFEYAADNADLARFAYNCVYGPLEQPAAAMIMEDYSEVLEQLNLLVERAVRAGVLRKGPIREPVRALRGIMDVYISDHLLGWLDELGGKDAEKVVKGLLEGYGG